ncbi:NAD(P)-binding domain-containing protein [Actinomadura barringtoniae]|uniref:NAD(P)-binding domain-containing protein n=1 Tax=Actinomadura barringtoniae TaxID=1427535 RepID=A0A939TAD7_9ACTN|nr:NAD(P)-binding domain-containing protein [Actinomadura barringtoniae]MBO2448960.1 NAD(P)-binding domain-containing protein [Actinomadura barringtoniae]
MGTGEVGQSLATGLVKAGHTVTLGSRTADNAAAAAWAADTGGRHGTFADAASSAELIVNATSGLVSVEALTAAGAENLADKVVVDVANPLDFSDGYPPKVATFEEGISLAEHIQRTFPDAHVVKTLCTVNNAVMVDPGRVPGDHNIFVSGDDRDAKKVASGLLGDLGWTSDQIIDLGGLPTARPIEQNILLWLVLSQALGTYDFNISVQRAG